MRLDRTFDIINFQLSNHSLDKAVGYKLKDKWEYYSSQEVNEAIDRIATVFLRENFQKGDHIVLIPESVTPDMLFVDLAAQSIGVIPVIVHATFTKAQLDHIIEEVNPKLICFNTEQLMDNFGFTSPEQKNITHLELSNGLFNYKNDISVENELIDQQKEKVSPEDLAVIIYTSGTTDVPKGVMLTHRNLMSNLTTFMALVPVDCGSRVITYLPFSHILERAAIYTYLALGMSIHMVRDRYSLSSVFQEVRPQFFTAVPRIIEKIFEGVEDFRSSRSWLKRKILSWSVSIGTNYQPYKKYNPFYSLFLLLAKYVFLRRIRLGLGGKVRGIVVGGAHLQPRLARLLHVAGISVREGYGMTETSPVISINRFEPGMNMYGTVGLPLHNVKVRIDYHEGEEEGEILVKGPNVMKGYFKKPDKTKKVLTDDGWLRTGDVGRFVGKRFLQITDRKKDIFKTSAGKYISPNVLETTFKDLPLIKQIVIIGFHRPFVTALIFPNFDLIKKWAKENKIHWTSPTYMAHNIKVIQRIKEEIGSINETLPKFKRIQEFHLVSDEWTVENGLLSATLKPIRRKIEEQYSKEIEKMYV